MYIGFSYREQEKKKYMFIRKTIIPKKCLI